MAIFYDAPIVPDALTTYIRRQPLPTGNALSAMFPEVFKPTNMVDFLEIVKKSRTAKYRSFDGRISVSERDSGTEKRVPLAPLSSSLGLGEYERLQLEYARLGGTAKEQLVQAIYNDAENLTNEIRNRVELAWGDVLSDGKLTINENGLVAEADYGIPANHKATAATLWTDIANATPVTDMLAWSDIWVNDNGTSPGSILTSQKIIRALQRNKEIINMVYGAQTGRTLANLEDINALFASLGIPTLLPHYDTKLSVDNADVRVIADNLVVFLPDDLRELGYMAWGMSATALELLDAKSTEYTFQDAPGIVGVVIKEGPPFRQYTFVDAIGQPIIENPYKIFIGTVA
ncbi:major capsid protein [Nocardia brasiliensis]|uniref:major capsid protein n=1 Tax=Nocardia brasiliensis TaxID=37326 RepID=UPI0024551C66|nr:major capsid protein [Nocardia brasiliensis]